VKKSENSKNKLPSERTVGEGQGWSLIFSHLFNVKEKSSHSTFSSQYHRLSCFAREMGALPSLDRVMVLTYIKLSKGFNTNEQSQEERESVYSQGYTSNSFLSFRLRHRAAD
jgi:hypothetical protein